MFAQYAPLPLSHFKATLPQNATTSELTEFLSSYFRVVLPEWVVPNLVAVTILLGGLVVSAIAIMYVKIFKSRTFWLFRLQGSDSGNLLVVSPTSSFVIIEGLYAIGLLIMSWCMVARSNGRLASTDFGFSCLILGIPLLTGVWNGIWGLFLSCPFGIRGGGSIRASVLNFGFFAIPTVFCAITVVFTCLHGFSQRSASHQFFRFEAELRNQDPNSMPTIDQINQAAKVFQDGAYAYHRMAQGYTYFFCFAVLLTILLAAVGFYLRKIIQHHLRYNAEFLANDENAIEAKIWSSSVYYFPRVQMPEDAHSTPLRGRTRRLVLHSALKLVQSLSACICVSALLFSGITGYSAFSIYPQAVQGPEEIGHGIGVLLVFFGWVTVAAGFPCWWLITSSLFEPALLGWQSRRAAGTNMIIKSPAFNDSIPNFKEPIQGYDRRRLDSESEEPDAREEHSTEGYRMKSLSTFSNGSADGRNRNLSLTSRNSLQDQKSDMVTADVRVDKTFEESGFKRKPNQQKRSTIIVDTEAEEDELDSRERGSWRKPRQNR